ncbi:hypothetical protein BDA96_02G375200 [Sorghum bicolor]|jgi:hypothetical protein|uniref:Plant disease resistance WDH domain-containing protein n=3 Tax=Sorghum bicolor TaxID=4558 RepID=A0A921RTV3_SORBI|nr:hypothetical protein SORBI_3002G358000 [Sorghum bicolor]KAG0545599.1 hypothetical protein BDA96_02G375200 [Sorghum bicolor]KAG0545600.1 hypothetical protein BDA96_02G375200 [Sorghum bicolor]
MAAAWSSGAAVAARGIHIMDSSEGRMSAVPWVSLGVDDGADHEAEDAALARARGCDVYVGHGGGVRRMVAWLRAELELLGVPCVATDRRQCGDARALAVARAAMDVALVGVIVVTPVSLANPYAVEEIRVFLERGALVPVFVGIRQRDFVAEDVVERRSNLWETHGGELWKAYDGVEDEWREVVEGLARAEPVVELRLGDLRDRVLDVLQILGARLGRPAVAPAVRAWRAAADAEIPFPWNTGFVGRERELLDVEAMLRGGAPANDKAAGKRPMAQDGSITGTSFLLGVVCISAASGAGKTELVLEFAHRHAHEYKKVLWVHGEARYLRQSYLKLADHLGIAVGDNVLQTTTTERARSLHGIEGVAIEKIKKELTRDIPYLVVIDNLESERDWWDGRAITELLPLGGGRTHVIITTRLPSLQGVRVFELGNLDAPNSMHLMKGARMLRDEDMAVLTDIQEKVCGVSLGLALVGSILSEIAVSPAELREMMRDAPHRVPTWSPKDDATVRDNPGLVQLLDACFTLLRREAPAGLGKVAERLLEASSFLAPVPIPTAMLIHAACAGKTQWNRLTRELRRCFTSPLAPLETGRVEQNALAMLLRLGIARQSTRAGCVSVHGVFRTFGRKIGSGRVARAVVETIVAEQGGGAAQHADDHTWAACLSLFRFEAPDVSVELPPPELARFIRRSAVPLAVRCVTGYSAYGAALELLREATDVVLEAEDLYIGAPRLVNDRKYVAIDPKVYTKLAQARAELLVMRARIMLRAGERGIAEDYCLSAIGLLEVACGDCHPETLVVRAFLEQAVRV